MGAWILHGGDPDFDAAVGLAALFGVVGGDGAGLAVAGIGESSAVDAVVDEVVGHGACAVFGEALVVFGGASVVGMAADLDLHLGVSVEQGDELYEFVVGLLEEGALVEVEIEVAQDDGGSYLVGDGVGLVETWGFGGWCLGGVEAVEAYETYVVDVVVGAGKEVVTGDLHEVGGGGRVEVADGEELLTAFGNEFAADKGPVVGVVEDTLSGIDYLGVEVGGDGLAHMSGHAAYLLVHEEAEDGVGDAVVCEEAADGGYLVGRIFGEADVEAETVGAVGQQGLSELCLEVFAVVGLGTVDAAVAVAVFGGLDAELVLGNAAFARTAYIIIVGAAFGGLVPSVHDGEGAEGVDLLGTLYVLLK